MRRSADWSSLHELTAKNSHFISDVKTLHAEPAALLVLHPIRHYQGIGEESDIGEPTWDRDLSCLRVRAASTLARYAAKSLILYCRRRAARKQLPRPKACQACRKTKSKCDFKQPCSRCFGRQYACSYGKEHDVVSASVPLGVEDGVVSTKESTYSEETLLNGFHLPTTLTDSLHAVRTDDSMDLGLVASKDLTLLSNSQTYLDNGVHPCELVVDMSSLEKQESLGTVSFTADQYASAISLSQVDQTIDIGSCPTNNWDFLMMDPVLYQLSSQQLAVTAPMRNNQPFIHDQGVHPVRTYPRMMTQQRNLPPFIHFLGCTSGYLEFDQGCVAWDQLKPLEACISIAHMFTSREALSSGIIWRTIDNEHRRIHEGAHQLSCGETLAATQAMAIYVIMRLSYSGHDYFAVNREMLKTIAVLAQRFSHLCPGPFSPPPSSIRQPTWQEWVFDESRRRLGITCFLISLVVGTEACGAIMNPHLLYLPSKKTLWEAQSEQEWRNEYDASWAEVKESSKNGQQPRLDTVGDLALSKHGGLSTVGQLEWGDVLDRWHAALDGLGMMLAAVISGI
ncbi:hypothetical protein B0H66DRAFT_587704 [Apodospora peruviana]|uniref:Zn(2)-C6 fungal-type domain-containing protein n=1 Tax=Apodospora peruviana TaxID=516989 RepID=A0AAE0IUG7_9PEZI|nr:hypothetical protein B0H66DRAFT_587704 [Apodospora peruviana]